MASQQKGQKEAPPERISGANDAGQAATERAQVGMTQVLEEPKNQLVVSENGATKVAIKIDLHLADQYIRMLSPTRERRLTRISRNLTHRKRYGLADIATASSSSSAMYIDL